MAVNSTIVFATPVGPMIQATQDEVLALIDNLRDSIPDPSNTSPGNNAQPDWDGMPPLMAARIRVELAAMKTAIDATPIA